MIDNEILNVLDNFIDYADQVRLQDFELIATNNAREAAQVALQQLLKSATYEALETNIEYFKYPPLMQRLMENIDNPAHVIVNADATDAMVGDEDLLGSYDDFVAGQEAAGGHTQSPNAPFVWRYGIYLPFLKGKSSELFPDMVEYEDVIDARLAAWGDKAPFWFFLEDGTGPGATPEFDGTYFLTKVRGKVEPQLRYARLLSAEAIYAQLSDITGALISNPYHKQSVTIEVVPLESGHLRETVRTSRKGKWQRIREGSGRFMSNQKARELGLIAG